MENVRTQINELQNVMASLINSLDNTNKNLPSNTNEEELNKSKNILNQMREINKKINSNTAATEIFKEVKNLYELVIASKDEIQTQKIKNVLERIEPVANKYSKLAKDLSNQDEIKETNVEQSISEEEIQKKIEEYVYARNTIDELIGNAKDYVGNRQAYIKAMEDFRRELEEIKRELNPEGLIDSPNLRKAEEAYKAQLAREPYVRRFADRNPNETSYDDMSIESLEELLNRKKAERDEIHRVVVSSGDVALEEEQAKYDQLTEEIRKIEEAIAKKRARANDNNGTTRVNNDNNEKSYENMSIESLEELLNRKKAERDEIHRVVVSSGDGASEEEQAKFEQLNEEIRKIEEAIAQKRARSNNNGDSSDNNATSYEDMSLEELEELLNSKKEERDELYRVVASAGDGASEGEQAKYDQLTEEIRKIEEEIAKKKAKVNTEVNGGPEQTGPEQTGPEQTGPEQTGPEQTGPEQTGPEQTGPEQTGPEQTGPEQTGPEQTGPEQTGPEQTGPEQTGPEQTGPEQTGPEQTGPEQTGPEQTGPEQTGPEFKVMLKKAWNWVKDHKKQILVIAGLAFTAAMIVALLQYLIPAIIAAQEAANVSVVCQAMLSNAANWHTAIASEQAALHGANTALGSMIEAMTGNKAVFDTASGIWSFGQSGMELGAFAQEAALTAAKAAGKVTSLSRTAGLLGFSGLSLIGTGVLLQNRSAAYKAYKDEMKQCSNKLNNNMIIEFYSEIDILEQAISNDSRLSNEEKIKLLKKIKKLKLKASKVQLNTQKNPIKEANSEEEAQSRGGISR